MLEFKDGKCICGTVRVGERGQIVIPKKAREYFNVEAGDSLIVIGDKSNNTMTIMKADSLNEFVLQLKSLEDEK
ncbi:AbrB/MazE/SpoVT family DNA-binding domain-containing protein [Culicoidibacter larvae]|uniref:AbrB family transcriptional regulator n=1 Tax=Culicoidibacter larvae TaxID=2579976 RepID=A0A5R8QER4_9FIRM|nr:AbrB/MazE/SpoVT family DNA-binding domain-containing protein [Culicoidibacter larvae]TLG75466.1 AbrB family transcriptional regulator [Culicoidibacter larvae]